MGSSEANRQYFRLNPLGDHEGEYASGSAANQVLPPRLLGVPEFPEPTHAGRAQFREVSNCEQPSRFLRLIMSANSSLRQSNLEHGHRSCQPGRLTQELWPSFSFEMNCPSTYGVKSPELLVRTWFQYTSGMGTRRLYPPEKLCDRSCRRSACDFLELS
jgi:hypothetical protein